MQASWQTCSRNDFDNPVTFPPKLPSLTDQICLSAQILAIRRFSGHGVCFVVLILDLLIAVCRVHFCVCYFVVCNAIFISSFDNVQVSRLLISVSTM